MLERLERTRDGDRFDELLDELLPGDEAARATAAELLTRLPSGSYRHISVIAKCGECGVREAIPQIRTAFTNAERNLQDTRASSLTALDRLLGPAERIEFLIDAMSHRDYVLAETAAIRIEGSEDPVVVEPLLAWLQDRLRRHRSKTQAHCTAEVIATCVRLGDPEQLTRLRAILDEVRLTEIEQRAADGRFPGLVALHGPFPIIDWPD